MLMSIKNVRKKFGGVEVLKDLNMEINKGDVVVILGPSGSGKTTFLRCLNFLERADEGQMEFADMNIDLSKPSDKEIAAVRKRRPSCSRDIICLPTRPFWKTSCSA